MKISDIIDKFETTPFLFVGSGLSMRYLNLPNWRQLLFHFANLVKNDEFSFSYYENKAKTFHCPQGVLPKAAELIQYDFDEKWFQDSSIRKIDERMQKAVKDGLSPFKAEMACYIKNVSNLNENYASEIKKLSLLSKKNISGVITTNYDTFLEDNFDGYRTFVGQEELIFSSLQGIGEIYKIHGSITNPSSIIINENDYNKFGENEEYLAAKLMTTFMEYPIIFLGYSISDPNIQNILQSIVKCISNEKMSKLKDRFVFVEYNPAINEPVIMPHTFIFNEKQITMTQIQLSDFSLLYTVMSKKYTKFPVKILRQFKENLYDFVLTENPTSKIQVADIDDERLSDDDLILSIGKPEFGKFGLTGISAANWYKSIIDGSLEKDASADDLLDYTAPTLLKNNSGLLPVNKYLNLSKKEHEEIQAVAEKQTFDFLISNTIKSHRNYNPYKSIREIIDAKIDAQHKVTFAAYLQENQIDLKDLLELLNQVFIDNPNVLENGSPSFKTDVRRLIRIYDCLKWPIKKSTSFSS